MPTDNVCRKMRILQSLILIGSGLCLLNTAQAKPRTKATKPTTQSPTPRKPSLGVGLEVGGASYSAEETIRPTLALRASFSLVKTLRRGLARGLPTNWVGVYGRLQSDFDDDHVRTAAGVTTGLFLIHGDLGWTKYKGEQSDHSGPELLLGLGLFDIVGVYTRWAWLSNDQSIGELGIRVNYPLWVGQSRTNNRRNQSRANKGRK